MTNIMKAIDDQLAYHQDMVKGLTQIRKAITTLHAPPGSEEHLVLSRAGQPEHLALASVKVIKRLSPAARRAMSLAQKRRWEAFRKNK